MLLYRRKSAYSFKLRRKLIAMTDLLYGPLCCRQTTKRPPRSLALPLRALRSGIADLVSGIAAPQLFSKDRSSSATWLLGIRLNFLTTKS